MHLFAALLAGTAATTGLMLTPVGNIYSSCASARAAGAAPLYAGQPGYNRRLDLDGDGVACERGGAPATGTGGLATGSTAPAAPDSARVPSAPEADWPTYATVVTWTGTNCIHITAPSGTPDALQTSPHCGGQATLFSRGIGDQMVGADPVIGDATSLSCEILSGRLMDSGTAGDGHDVSCLTRASALS
ncbi:excalibur calcium-binding domain-containing protein [Mycolicibacterium sp. 050232]|uniref:excalibur calcium-binding domain-containing protein n=1 Tax=Mycolicibacterium sp. 050232 TaxID=3113982 RepID=UPI002E2B983F|nr:excalibur calcium-binding domain-containing protein [Mycolicibacterium sp. 050232]MED5816125.1 excalibur calcium-binding domain-containing protein [Mycolicibacterium sp. 050232]